MQLAADDKGSTKDDLRRQLVLGRDVMTVNIRLGESTTSKVSTSGFIGEGRLTSRRWRRFVQLGRLEVDTQHPTCSVCAVFWAMGQTYLDVEPCPIWFIKVFARSCDLR